MRPEGAPIKTLLWRTFTPAILVLAIAFGALVFNRLYDTILDGFSRKLVTTSALTAAFVDPADHDFLLRAAQVRAPADLVEVMPRYQRNVEPMKRIRKELGLTYLYSQALGGTKDVIYVLDTSEGDEHTPLGSEDDLTEETRRGLRQALDSGGIYVSPIEYQEQWGLLKTAGAPMYGRDGVARATTGADVNINVIEVATQNALFASALIGAASLLASALVTLVIVRWVAVPIEGLKADALRIAAGDRAPPARRAGPREVSRLRDGLSDLAAHLTGVMRQAWTDTLATDRARNGEALAAALPPAAPVVLCDPGGARIVWTPAADDVEARLEHRAMTLLAARFAVDSRLAARWRDLAVARHGELREQPGGAS